MNDFLFIYAKNGTILCLTAEDARIKEPSLLPSGWKHTATIKASAWINYLVNDAPDPFLQFDELRGMDLKRIDYVKLTTAGAKQAHSVVKNVIKEK